MQPPWLTAITRQIGRAEGKDIVQLGDDSRGLNTRWRFTEITADSSIGSARKDLLRAILGKSH